MPTPVPFSFHEFDLDGARAAIAQNYFPTTLDLCSAAAPYEFRFIGHAHGPLTVGDAWYTSGNSSEMVAAPLREAVLHGLLRAVDHPYRDALDAPAPSFGPAALRRIVHAVEADPTCAFTLTDMARIAAVSVRTLQELYRRHLDTTPTEHLRRTRLARAHQQLRASDRTETTVSAVAGRSGFVHLGRFAEAYRARYDEPPSATLRRTD